MTLMEKLVSLRKEHKFSQEELAEKLGVSRQTISKWERGEASPDMGNAIQLAKIYDISLDEIARCITGEEDPVKPHGISLKKETYRNAAESSAASNEYIRMVLPEKESDEIYPQLNAYKSADGGNVSDKMPERKTVHEEKTFENDQESVRVQKIKGYFTDYQREAVGKKLMKFPFWALAIFIFLFFGGVLRLWEYSWIVFLLIPVYYTTIKAWVSKNAFYFLYPLFATAAFCFLCMAFNGESLMAAFFAVWTFGSIPLYYTSIIAYRKKKCKFFCFPVAVAILFVSGTLVFGSGELWLWLFALIPFYYIYSSKIDEKIFGGKK